MLFLYLYCLILHIVAALSVGLCEDARGERGEMVGERRERAEDGATIATLVKISTTNGDDTSSCGNANLNSQNKSRRY